MRNGTPLYTIEPPLPIERLVEVADQVRGMGSSLQEITSPWLALQAQHLLKEQGARSLLSLTSLTEAVLPDNTPRDVLLETIRYQLNSCRPTTSLLIVDPYLFPSQPDANYRADLLSLVEPSVRAGIDLTIATKTSRNAALEAAFLSDLAGIRPGATAQIKYTNVFHDRFWIADHERGLFMGTSLNGIGRRYAVADYLHEDDAQAISARFAALP